MKRNLYFLLPLLFYTVYSSAQMPNWQNMDMKADSVFGISTEKAYNELLKGKTPHRVIVAVIDAGVDTLHEDLKSVLWLNSKKKKGDNGTYGWSYIGSAEGNVRYDNLELARQVRQYRQKDTTKLSINELIAYHKEASELRQKLIDGQRSLVGMLNFMHTLNGITQKMSKTYPALANFKAYVPVNAAESQVTHTVINMLSQKDDFKEFKEQKLSAGIEHYKTLLDYQLNTDYDPRQMYVGDDYFNSEQRDYGTPDNNGPDPTHGTHVAGIIAADRNNDIGIKGVADNVQILAIRAVPDGDERDKDVANAIRYAVDHGARVINMSFGKPYSQDKKAVDEAVKYALKKDVLFVQAAGNDDQNIDTASNFPNRIYADGKQADAWIVVGASGEKDNENLKAGFSNYGKTSVDVFAPGVQIYSSIPGSKYAYLDGTSMACPVVAGLAALIREYYPKLKASQVKDIILKSVVNVDHPILLDKKLVPFTDLCRTGGIVNAYRALQIASYY